MKLGFIQRVLNFFNFNSVRPLINKEGEIFLRNLNDEDFTEKIEEIKKGKPTSFNSGEKDFKLNLVRNIEPIIE